MRIQDLLPCLILGIEPRTAWMQEEGEFEDLFTGKKIELKDVELAAHGFVWAVRRK